MKLRNGFALEAICLVELLLVCTAAKAAYVALATSGTIVPSVIEPGGSGNLVLTISNSGTEYARNVKLTLTPHSFITFQTGVYSLQTISPSSSVQVSVPIKVSSSTPEGSTSVFMTLDYTEGTSTGTVSLQTSVSVSVTKRSLMEITNVSYSKAMIELGDTVRMSIELKNVGSGNVKNLFVALNDRTQPFVPVGGDTEMYVGDLLAGGLTTANFDIIINKDAQTIAYSVPVTLKYYDETGANHTESKYVGLKVSGVPEFIVALESERDAYAGAVGELTISVANRGTASARFLTMQFDAGLGVTPENYYIGDLDPDGYETVSISVDMSGLQVGKHELEVSLLYKDPYNVEMTQTGSVTFTVYSMPPFTIPLTGQIIIVAVVAIVLYWKRKAVMGLASRIVGRRK